MRSKKKCGTNKAEKTGKKRSARSKTSFLNQLKERKRIERGFSSKKTCKQLFRKKGIGHASLRGRTTVSREGEG